MLNSPWPMRAGSLLLREADSNDLDTMLALRVNPVVNRFMLHIEVDPDDFRREWLGMRHSETESEHSCVAERDG